MQWKEKWTKHTNKKNTTLKCVVQQEKRNKLSTHYKPAFYVIFRIDCSSIAARRVVKNYTGMQANSACTEKKQCGKCCRGR